MSYDAWKTRSPDDQRELDNPGLEPAKCDRCGHEMLEKDLFEGECVVCQLTCRKCGEMMTRDQLVHGECLVCWRHQKLKHVEECRERDAMEEWDGDELPF
ncbi:MAG: hypothetical protein GY937_20090 [bacterium]|nr:hypothetical protein [bacterium]